MSDEAEIVDGTGTPVFRQHTDPPYGRVPDRPTDLVLPTGEVYDLEQVLEDRWQRAAQLFDGGDPAQLLALGSALSEARSLVYRLKQRCDERVRETLARRGDTSMVAGYWQAKERTGAATYTDVEGLRAELIGAGMDADAAAQFFTLTVTDGAKLRTLANRNDAYAHALERHTTRGNPGVSYKRAGP